MRSVVISCAFVFVASTSAARVGNEGTYAVLEVTTANNANVLQAEVVQFETPFVVQREGGESDDHWEVVVIQQGQITYRQFIAEAMTRGQTMCSSRVASRDSLVLAVRLPILPSDEAVVELRQGARNVAVTFESLEAALRAPTLVHTDRVDLGPRGDPRNRVDLVVLGDGYTRDQESIFFADAQHVTSRFFGLQPYANYANYFNVVALFVPSLQSGADHPYCADPAAKDDPKQGVYADTAFDASYCSFGVQRLLTVSTRRFTREVQQEGSVERGDLEH